MEQKLNSILKAKKENDKQAQGLFQLSRNKCVKEHLILSLRTDINHYRNENLYSNKTYEHVSLLRNKLEDNGKKLENYFQDIKDQLKEFATQVEKYEKKIEKYSTSKRQIINSNEAILKQKNHEQTELKHQYDIMNSKIEIQLNQLKELETKQKKLITKKEEEKKAFLQLETKARQKEYDLNGQYRVLLSKYEEYQHEKEQENTESIMAQRINKTVVMSPEEIKIKLSEMKSKNSVLLGETDSLGIKISKATSNKRKSIQDNSIDRKTKTHFTSNSPPYTTVFTTNK